MQKVLEAIDRKVSILFALRFFVFVFFYGVRKRPASFVKKNSHAESTKREGCKNGKGKRWRYSQGSLHLIEIV